jgi:hypothetical protein
MSSHTVTIQISKEEAQVLKQRTGKRTAGAAVATAIGRAVQEPLTVESQRAVSALVVLRAAARKAPIAKMRPSDIDAIIKKVRAEHVQKGIA